MNTSTSQNNKPRNSCDGCRYYLGGNLCRLNVEKECADGGRELYESSDDDGKPLSWSECTFFFVALILTSMLWGIVLYKIYCLIV